MKEIFKMIIHGDSLHELTKLNDNSIDAVISDPPYGLSNISHANLMNCLKEWALGNYSYLPQAKGFMGKSWDGFVPPPALWKEVYRVMKPGAHALIFAGSRTQDLMGLSLRVAGFEIRDVLQWLYGSGFPKSHDVSKAIDKLKGAKRAVMGKGRSGKTAIWQAGGMGDVNITAPATQQAKKYDGYGTALKPAYEPILLVRKPLIGTVAENVLEHGTGGLNIDGCRIDTDEIFIQGGLSFNRVYGKEIRKGGKIYDKGRYPSNVILDERASNLLDIQAPTVNRFFYCAKAQPNERKAGLDGYNMHPTVKPIELMKYLCTLITPSGGTILEPFLGSGSTAIAANLLGFKCIGIERELDYVKIAEARLKYWTLNYEPIYNDKIEDDKDIQLTLF